MTDQTAGLPTGSPPRLSRLRSSAAKVLQRLEPAPRTAWALTALVAVVLALPDAVVLARNAARARRVDEDVVRWQLERVAVAVGDGVLAGEGCAAVWILRTPDAIDAITVARLPVSGPPGISPNPPPPPQ